MLPTSKRNLEINIIKNILIIFLICYCFAYLLNIFFLNLIQMHISNRYCDNC